MTPEYLEELADLADPDQLWRLRGFDQLDLPADKRRQLDIGVALRRHASHVRELRELIGTGKSLLLTPYGPSCTDHRTIDIPVPDVAKRAADYSARISPQ